MKLIYLALVLGLCLSEFAFAKTFEGSLLGTLGIKTPSGSRGVEAAIYPLSSYDLHLGVGQGLFAPIVSIGARGYVPRTRCTLFPACHLLPYGGLDLGLSLKKSVSRTNASGISEEYELGPMGLAFASVGLRWAFFERLILDAGLGYQFLLNRDIEAVSSGDHLEEDTINKSYDSGVNLRLGIGIGW